MPKRLMEWETLGRGVNAVCKLYVTKNLEKIEFGLIFQWQMVWGRMPTGDALIIHKPVVAN